MKKNCGPSKKGMTKGMPAAVARSPANTQKRGKMEGVRSTTSNKKY